MTEEQKKTELWTDESGSYYPWLEELWALQAKREAEFAARGESMLRMASDMPLPTLSFLVSCMTAIRNRPELMSKIKDLARRYPQPEQIPEGEDHDLANLIGMFLTWLELKDGQDNLGLARSTLYGILYRIELGKTGDSGRRPNPPRKPNRIFHRRPGVSRGGAHHG